LPESNFCADIFNSIFATGPAVALIVTLFLDNTVPGSRKERGLHVWQQLDASGADWWEDDHMNRVRALTPTPARTRTACTLHPVMETPAAAVEQQRASCLHSSAATCC
jgi:hypothetical protein